MTTAADLIDECVGHLLSGTREQTNLLGAAISDTTSPGVTLVDILGGVQAGSVISVDQELMFVRSAAGVAATVIRGYAGSTAATHSNGAIVAVNPKFDRFRVFKALNNELLGLSSPTKGLFKVGTVDLTYNSAFQGYDLAADTAIEDLLEVRAQRNGSDRGWDTLGRTQIQLQRNMPTSVFASGFALQLLRGDQGKTVRVIYRAPFGALGDETTDPQSATVGFPATANDILPLGAAMHLALTREVQRNFNERQGEPRRAEEVPAGANVRAAGALKSLYDERVRDEAQRLQRKYPLRRYA